MANLYSLIAVSNGCKKPPKMSDIFRSWGLMYEASSLDESMKEVREMETVRAFEMMFGPIQEQKEKSDA